MSSNNDEGEVINPPEKLGKQARHTRNKRRKAEQKLKKKQKKREKALQRKKEEGERQESALESEFSDNEGSSGDEDDPDFIWKQAVEYVDIVKSLIGKCSKYEARAILAQLERDEETRVTDMETPRNPTVGSSSSTSTLSPNATVFTPAVTAVLEKINSSSVGNPSTCGHVNKKLYKASAGLFSSLAAKGKLEAPMKLDRDRHKNIYRNVLEEICRKIPRIAEIEPNMFAGSYGHVQWDFKDFREEEMPNRHIKTKCLRNRRPLFKPYRYRGHVNPFYYETPEELIGSYSICKRTFPESNIVEMKRKLADLRDIREMIECRITNEMHDKYTDRIWKALEFLFAYRIGPVIQALELKLWKFQRSRLWRLKQKRGRSHLGVLLEMTKENNDNEHHWKKRKQRKRRKNNWKGTLVDNTEMNARILKAKFDIGADKKSNLGLHVQAMGKKESFFLFNFVDD